MNRNFKFVKYKKRVVLLFTLLTIFSVWHGMSLFALDKTDKEIVVEDNNKFAFDLYSQVKKEDGNFFFSPFSISTALAMTYAGAKGNTETQMAETLRFSLSQERLHPAFLTLMQELQADSEKKGFELSIANALWGQEGYKFHEAFIDITESYYEAGFKEVDFIKNTEQTRQSINTWVEEKTNDKIKELIKPGILNDLTRLVLTNAIYFKGKWMSQFIKERTSQQEFKLLSGKKVEIPMMNQTKEFGYFENDGLRVLEMPYEGDKLTMVILLPKETNSINNLENSLCPENVKGWLSRLQKQEVIVFMPKFKMTSEFELNKTLEILGMTDAFSEKADFSGMTPDLVGLYISKVIHKAFVDVNEEGTEAAAATAVVMQKLAISEPKPVFRADRPFVFVIRDMKSGSILFIGRVMDPR